VACHERPTTATTATTNPYMEAVIPPKSPKLFKNPNGATSQKRLPFTFNSLYPSN
jgi:hypothetical protein